MLFSFRIHNSLNSLNCHWRRQKFLTSRFPFSLHSHLWSFTTKRAWYNIWPVIQEREFLKGPRQGFGKITQTLAMGSGKKTGHFRANQQLRQRWVLICTYNSRSLAKNCDGNCALCADTIASSTVGFLKGCDWQRSLCHSSLPPRKSISPWVKCWFTQYRPHVCRKVPNPGVMRWTKTPCPLCIPGTLVLTPKNWKKQHAHKFIILPSAPKTYQNVNNEVALCLVLIDWLMKDVFDIFSWSVHFLVVTGSLCIFVHLLCVRTTKSRTWGMVVIHSQGPPLGTRTNGQRMLLHSNTSVLNRHSEKHCLLSVSKGLGSFISQQGSSTALYTAPTNSCITIS